MNPVASLQSLWSTTRAIFNGGTKTTVVICPSAERPAMVALGAIDRLESCSRWPELEGCSRACMPQVQFSDEELEGFTTRYGGKACTSCGVALSQDDWYQSRLAALDAKTAATEVPFPAHNGPVCASCHARTNIR